MDGLATILATLAATVATVVGPVASAQPPPESQPSAAMLAFVQRARADLDTHLIDYPSARFRTVFTSMFQTRKALFNPHPQTYRIFCGLVNSKNSMGGFVGWTPFFLAPDSTSEFEQLVTGNLAAQACGKVTSDDGIDYANRLAFSGPLSVPPRLETQPLPFTE